MTRAKAKKRQRPRAAVNKVTASYRVSDELWTVLQPVVPVPVNRHRFGGGRPRVPDRQGADAIFYVLRTGWQWGALDATDLCPLHGP
jgi:transposase